MQREYRISSLALREISGHLALAAGVCQESVDVRDIVNVESFRRETAAAVGSARSNSRCIHHARRGSPLIG